jgi:hypothetical protein
VLQEAHPLGAPKGRAEVGKARRAALAAAGGEPKGVATTRSPRRRGVELLPLAAAGVDGGRCSIPRMEALREQLQHGWRGVPEQRLFVSNYMSGGLAYLEWQRSVMGGSSMWKNSRMRQRR